MSKITLPELPSMEFHEDLFSQGSIEPQTTEASRKMDAELDELLADKGVEKPEDSSEDTQEMNISEVREAIQGVDENGENND